MSLLNTKLSLKEAVLCYCGEDGGVRHVLANVLFLIIPKKISAALSLVCERVNNNVLSALARTVV